MKATFQNTVNILVKAYFDNTLHHLDCAACAVGNIIAASLNAEVIKDDDYNLNVWKRGANTLVPIWQKVFYTPKPEGKQRKWPKKFIGYPKLQIEATGYTWQELARIEKAFESVPVPLKNNKLARLECNIDLDQWMFDGLMAVVECLADIHKIDLLTKQSAKLMFIKV